MSEAGRPPPAYANRLPDESVNYDTVHPLAEFAWLAGGVLAIAVACSALIGYFAGELAARVPFRVEREFAMKFDDYWKNASAPADVTEAERTLQSMADTLLGRMSAPPDMKVTVHLNSQPVVNAYASLGGHLVFYRGLLDKLDSEDAVATVLAHEVAHAVHRHPAAHLGRGVAVGLLLSLVSVSAGDSAAGRIVNTAGSLPLLKYGRDQEREADTDGAAALVAVYGHVGGAMDVFRTFAALGASSGVEALETHPLTPARIRSLEDHARRMGWALDGPRKPVPAAIMKLRTGAAP